MITFSRIVANQEKFVKIIREAVDTTLEEKEN